MDVFTIGFTQKSAEQFFRLLTVANVQRVIDIRLNNSSQLSGFAKRDDLRFFLKEIAGIDYHAEPLFAPTQEILAAYRKKIITWDECEEQFEALMREREVEKRIDPAILDGGCLLCSEAEPHHCHRRLVAEYLNRYWGSIEVHHLT